MIASTEEAMTQIWDKASHMMAENPKLKELMELYAKESKERDVLFTSLVNVYENELGRLKSQGDDKLSPKQKSIIAKEFKNLEDITCTGVRSTFKESLPEQQVVDEHFFEQFVATFSEKCPLLKNVVETLLVSNVHQRNLHKNVDYKVLCGAHALSLLLNVRSAKGNNDFPLLFGLLCISYGAGKQFTNMLHSLGLSVHWDTM